MPRFSHKPLSVIHPSPTKASRKELHTAPNTLAFDGTPASLNKRKDRFKDIPEHLVKPQIDEETLMKIRAKEKLREEQRKAALNGSTKKASLASQKAELAVAKTKTEV